MQKKSLFVYYRLILNLKIIIETKQEKLNLNMQINLKNTMILSIGKTNIKRCRHKMLK
jgi:hypothetical protein